MTAAPGAWEPLDTPRQLILTVTDVCNHFCDMCYYHASLNQRSRLLSLEEYGHLSAGLGHVELLLISGGEPFLRRDLVDVVEVFHRGNRTRTIFLPTNGSVPDTIANSVAAMLERMPDLHITLMFSLEGLEAEHDRIHGKKGAFASVLKSIRRVTLLRAHRAVHGKPPFGILLNTVVSGRNVPEVLPLMDFVKRNVRVDNHTFSPMRGSGPEPGTRPPDPEVFAALVRDAQPWFEHYLGRHGDARRVVADRYALWTDLIAGKPLVIPCQAGNYIGVIEPDGRVRLCESTPVVGDLRDFDFDFRRLWQSVAAEKERALVPGCSCTHACFLNASEQHRSGRWRQPPAGPSSRAEPVAEPPVKR